MNDLNRHTDDMGRWHLGDSGGGIPWLEVHGHHGSFFPSGRWETPFNPAKNKLEDFHVDESTSVKVPMMFQDKHHHWYLRDKYLPCSVLRMDYKGNAKAFFILPDQGKMKQVEGFLTPEMLARWNSLLQHR